MSALRAVSESAASDLAAVREGRGLGPRAAERLTRAVTGAVRPNRDRPLWDLAHALVALRLDGPGAVDLALDPGLARPDALRAKLDGAACAEDGGLQMDGARPWRCSWGELTHLLSLMEFMLTADGCSGFAELSGAVDRAAADGDAPALSRRLVSFINAWRERHMPLAAHERAFRSVLTFLRGRAGDVTDAAILDYWLAGAGGDALYTTVVERFATFERLAAEVGQMAALGDATALSGIEDWEDRLSAASVAPGEAHALGPVLEAFDREAVDGPKALTGAEREAIGATLRLEPYHRTRPLTALRALAFGRVQSGIANRLRRGTGGEDVAVRVEAQDADYEAFSARAGRLAAHLERLLTIALALREAGPDALRERGERELARLRRAGFERPRDELAERMARLDEALSTMAGEMSQHRAALERLNAREPLEERCERDRAMFKEGFTALYLSDAAHAASGATR